MPTTSTSLADDFIKLGLAQYLERFVDEGFDDWNSIADITESDLAALGVKLGHRRILFRQIATLRGRPQQYDRQYTSLTSSGHPPIEPLDDVSGAQSDISYYQPTDDNHIAQSQAGSGASDSLRSPPPGASSIPAKRRYKRHPKPDDNAPLRPASAYVLFANQVREEQKDSNLNFTQLARLVGDRWKNLKTLEKDAIVAQAAEAKKQYNFEVGNYKKSHEYQLYQDYLVEFKERALKDEKPEKLEPPRKSQRLNLRDSSDITSGHGYQLLRSSVEQRIDQMPSIPPMGRPFFSLPALRDPRDPLPRPPPTSLLPPPVGYTPPEYMPLSTPAAESYQRQSQMPYPMINNSHSGSPVGPPGPPVDGRRYDHLPRLPSIRSELPNLEDRAGSPRYRDPGDSRR